MSDGNDLADRSAVIGSLRAMLRRLADDLGTDASGLGEDDIIPDSGVLDSAGVIEFVMIIDTHYDLGLEAEDMTIDTLGSLTAIANLIVARRAAGA